jgi:hypothetical protein
LLVLPEEDKSTSKINWKEWKVEREIIKANTNLWKVLRNINKVRSSSFGYEIDDFLKKTKKLVRVTRWIMKTVKPNFFLSSCETLCDIKITYPKNAPKCLIFYTNPFCCQKTMKAMKAILCIGLRDLTFEKLMILECLYNYLPSLFSFI